MGLKNYRDKSATSPFDLPVSTRNEEIGDVAGKSTGSRGRHWFVADVTGKSVEFGLKRRCWRRWWYYSRGKFGDEELTRFHHSGICCDTSLIRSEICGRSINQLTNEPTNQSKHNLLGPVIDPFMKILTVCTST